jgi:hypothetical protein
LRVVVVMGRVSGEECDVSSSMGPYVFARKGVRKCERGDFIGQLFESCCIVGFQSLNRFPG